jgi:8-oxo-dGTP pyrophosphatase MutT (NUDIX family)
MELNFLSDKLHERLKLSLPGQLAHEPYKAIPVGSEKLLFTHVNPPRLGSVLILLYEEGGVIKFPLIKRPVYLGAHSGQVSFPGGKTEPGENVFQTALRECEEEIGINQHEVEVVGRLSDFFVIASNFVVTPVVGVLRSLPAFKPDPFEVAGIFSGNIPDLMRDQPILEKEILVAEKYQLRVPHFEINGEVVWGATAMMLNEFRMVVIEAFSASPR